MSDETDRFIEPGGILKPFPHAAGVFVAEHVHLRRHLHPLVSVDLAAVDPTWTGWAHLLGPIEPYDGLLGEQTVDAHNAFLRTNCLVFKIEHGRYRLLGEPRYFLLERLRDEVPENDREEYDVLAAHSVEAEASYRRSEASYRRLGRLHYLDRHGHVSPGNPEPQPLIDRIGGTVGFENWASGADFPLDVAPSDGSGSEPDAVWPLSPAGRRFQHVATTPGYPYRSGGADGVLLFYEPVEQLALLTFDWT